MPYDIRKSSDGYHVINQRTGEDKGVSKTRAKAEGHMRALYAHEPGKASTSPGTMTDSKGDLAMALNSSYRPEPIPHAYMGGKLVPSRPVAVAVADAVSTAAPVDGATDAIAQFKGGGKFKLFEKNEKGDKGPETKAEDAPEKSAKSMPPWMMKFAKKKK